MSGTGRLEHNIGAQVASTGIDEVIAGLAQCQHGVVSRTQLLELGISRRAIGHRLHCCRLHSVHRGVYAVGHRALTRHGRWMAAVLVGGPDAVLSHRSAAALWGLRISAPERIEISATRRIQLRPGLAPHRATLPSDEITVRDAIPVTTVPRTLLDLASVTDKRMLERALEQAEILRLADPLSPAALLQKHPIHRGAARLRAALEGAAPPTNTRSQLERRFLASVQKADLERPEVNALIDTAAARYEVDCLWREQRLIVELDGRATHDTSFAFERDRMRDRDLQATGYCVLRITWRQLTDDPDSVLADLARLLRQRASTSIQSSGAPHSFR